MSILLIMYNLLQKLITSEFVAHSSVFYTSANVITTDTCTLYILHVAIIYI